MGRTLRIVSMVVLFVLIWNIVSAFLGGPITRSAYILHAIGLGLTIIILLWRDATDRAAIRRSQQDGLPPTPGADVNSRNFGA